MRKIKKINGYLVVRFNDREKREYETLGTYGVIDAELYSGDIDIDRGAMEYDDADTLEVALEQARGLESELDAEEPAASYTIVKETDGAIYEYTIADPQMLMEEWEAELANQISNRRYTDMDPLAAAHERYGFLIALERLGLIEDAGCFTVPDIFRPALSENFAHASQGAPTRQIYALGLALLRACPGNDCMVYRNTFAMCLDLDEQIDRVTGLARSTLQAELYRHQHLLFQMYLNNYAIGEYRKELSAKQPITVTITPHKPGDGGIIALPLRCNVPTPKHGDWIPVTCPLCGSDCWESDLARTALAAAPSLRRACTACAIKEQNSKVANKARKTE